ncbi:hypothetical protein FRC02_005848 [Tulasnella sp. 418]|nr:hypothetical protein FRC02_005848 [Tulasnella sp. 418]
MPCVAPFTDVTSRSCFSKQWTCKHKRQVFHLYMGCKGVTPEAIVFSAIMLRFFLSSDSSFHRIGPSTGIN